MNPKPKIEKTNKGNKALIAVLIVSLILSLGCVCVYFITKSNASSGSCDVSSGGSSSGTSASSSDSGASEASGEKDKAPKASSERSSGKNSSSDSAKKSHNGKTWVPAQYKTVTHPAETRQEKKVVCRCGEYFDSRDAWLAHKNANGG